MNAAVLVAYNGSLRLCHIRGTVLLNEAGVGSIIIEDRDRLSLGVSTIMLKLLMCFFG